jgi:glycosyltransferase involved in cell wall biosynthesis
MTAPSVSLIITTYERPKALSLVLDSLSRLTTFPLEVVIADDGSTEPTKKVIADWQKKLPFRLIHAWQEDDGFRAAAARNKAAIASSGNYLIFLDGDCLVFPDFIRNHIQLSAHNKMVIGSRILCSKELTSEMESGLEKPLDWKLYAWTKAKFLKKINRVLPLVRLNDSWIRNLRGDKWKGVRTFNLGVWRDDFFAANGFDERFQGWGHEDADLAIRLIKNGIQRKDGQFSIPVLHLWHQESDRTKLNHNEKMLSDTLCSTTTRALLGIDQYKQTR